MSFWRATAIGALSGLSLAGILALLGLITETNGLFAGLVFIALRPVFDRITLRIGGDGGPRAFWAAASWSMLQVPLGICSHGSSDGTIDQFGLIDGRTEAWIVITIVIAAMAGASLLVMRIRGTTLRRIQPWLAVTATLIVVVVVAEHTFRGMPIDRHHWHAPPIVPGLGLLGLAIAVGSRIFRGAPDLDGTWERGTMTADGRVTVDGRPPMHAPAGIPHRAGRVLVELDAGPVEPTFRTTGAPKIVRLLQGIDADIDGRRALRDEGARAFATAAALLPAAAAYAAFLIGLARD